MTVTQLPSVPEILVVEAGFPVEAQVVFAYWTQPTLLQQWWPEEAEIKAELGGAYHLSWPAMHWNLRGYYTAFAPPTVLGFTWRWEHDEPEVPTRVVTVVLEQGAAGSTRLVLTHGPYTDTPTEQTIRNEHHLAGWLHFLEQLAGLLKGLC
ncbi:MAG: SRPBCC domain-containing protein [Herpetosiphonaceae bacterium]|nr:SRPBCC domain-containing protein [Herpetosiphonaceae bacterium]